MYRLPPPPLTLRFTISYYNEVLECTTKAAEKTEMHWLQYMDVLDVRMSLTIKEEEKLLRVSGSSLLKNHSPWLHSVYQQRTSE